MSDRLRMACKSRSISAMTTQASSRIMTYNATCIGLLSRNRIVCDRHLTQHHVIIITSSTSSSSMYHYYTVNLPALQLCETKCTLWTFAVLLPRQQWLYKNNYSCCSTTKYRRPVKQRILRFPKPRPRLRAFRSQTKNDSLSFNTKKTPWK